MTPFAINNNNKPYISRVKKTLLVMKAEKNDESNGTAVYIESSLEINRDIRKRRKISSVNDNL